MKCEGMSMNIEELKRLAEAATPGPWSSHPNGYYGVHSNTGTICSTGEKIADALYIAAANPAAILELIQQRDELLAALRGLYNVICYHDLTPDLLRKVNSIITKAGD